MCIESRNRETWPKVFQNREKFSQIQQKKCCDWEFNTSPHGGDAIPLPIGLQNLMVNLYIHQYIYFELYY